MLDNFGWVRSRKIIGQTAGKDMDLNSLSLDMMIYNRILWSCSIHIVNLTEETSSN